MMPETSFGARLYSERFILRAELKRGNQMTNANTISDRALRAVAQNGGPKGDRLAG
jgi:hypothetical protein